MLVLGEMCMCHKISADRQRALCMTRCRCMDRVPEWVKQLTHKPNDARHEGLQVCLTRCRCMDGVPEWMKQLTHKPNDARHEG